MRNARRLLTLARQQRVRTVERRKALALVAEARGEQARFEELTERSEALLAQYRSENGQLIGDELTLLAAFRNQLSIVTLSAEKMQRQAASNAHAAGQDLLKAQQRLDMAQERLAAETRNVTREKALAGASDGDPPRAWNRPKNDAGEKLAQDLLNAKQVGRKTAPATMSEPRSVVKDQPR